MKIVWIMLLVVSSCVCFRTARADDVSSASNIEKSQIETEMFGTETPHIKDSLAGFNKAMFTFNDKVYKYCLKPINIGYIAPANQIPNIL